MSYIELTKLFTDINILISDFKLLPLLNTECHFLCVPLCLLCDPLCNRFKHLC